MKSCWPSSRCGHGRPHGSCTSWRSPSPCSQEPGGRTRGQRLRLRHRPRHRRHDALRGTHAGGGDRRQLHLGHIRADTVFGALASPRARRSPSWPSPSGAPRHQRVSAFSRHQRRVRRGRHRPGVGRRDRHRLARRSQRAADCTSALRRSADRNTRRGLKASNSKPASTARRPWRTAARSLPRNPPRGSARTAGRPPGQWATWSTSGRLRCHAGRHSGIERLYRRHAPTNQGHRRPLPRVRLRGKKTANVPSGATSWASDRSGQAGDLDGFRQPLLARPVPTARFEGDPKVTDPPAPGRPGQRCRPSASPTTASKEWPFTACARDLLGTGDAASFAGTEAYSAGRAAPASLLGPLRLQGRWTIGAQSISRRRRGGSAPHVARTPRGPGGLRRGDLTWEMKRPVPQHEHPNSMTLVSGDTDPSEHHRQGQQGLALSRSPSG